MNREEAFAIVRRGLREVEEPFQRALVLSHTILLDRRGKPRVLEHRTVGTDHLFALEVADYTYGLEAIVSEAGQIDFTIAERVQVFMTVWGSGNRGEAWEALGLRPADGFGIAEHPLHEQFLGGVSEALRKGITAFEAIAAQAQPVADDIKLIVRLHVTGNAGNLKMIQVDPEVSAKLAELDLTLWAMSVGEGVPIR